MAVKKAAKKGTKKVAVKAKPDYKKAAAGVADMASAEPKEKLAPKLRRKADIVKALKAIGAHVLHTPEGLFRIIAGGKTHPASKRRIVAMIDGGGLKRDSQKPDRYLLDSK